MVILSGLAGCQQAERRPPPPEARRPVIKTQDELSVERDARIRSGTIKPTSAPVVLGADRVTNPALRPPAPPAPPVAPTPGAIEADILMVNNTALTAAEILYLLSDELEHIRQTQTRGGFREMARQRIRDEARKEIGTVLIYAEAMVNLGEQPKKQIEAAVQKEVDNRVAREFGGSTARLKAHLTENGLTLEQYRALLQRDMVVRQYTREKLMPLIQIRRDELLGEYQRNTARYGTSETRELLLIELPFEKFLPEGTTWETAAPAARAAAKLAAMRRAREAHAALADRPFEDVAREFSTGLHGDQGGSWGMIGKPLQPPYEEISRPIFEYAEGQTSEPLETATGWYIVKCGRIQPASHRAFTDAQDEIRRELMERRFNKLSVEYVLRLAENATISSLDLFVGAAVKRAEQRTNSTGGKAE